MKQFFKGFYLVLYLIILNAFLFSCTPKEEIVFKGVRNIVVQMDETKQEPLLTGEAFFYNPNNTKMKLKNYLH
ncbi:MAG: hypothetical protein U5K54_07470 [Cytophagales bacterium]|nr:hypothetical protein [Cytophagales bacterium]